MAVTGQPSLDHPMVAALDRVRAKVVDAGGVPTWSMDAGTTTEVLTRLTRLEAQVAALKLEVLAHAEQTDVAGQTGATSTANWYAHLTRTDRVEAHRVARLAEALERRPLLAAGLRAGEVSAAQAGVIAQALSQLPTDLDPGLVAKAEAHLVEQAGFHDPKTLRILGRRLFEVIAPDLADAHEAALLAAEERRAAAATWFTIGDDGQGTTRFKGQIPTLYGAMLKKALLALAAPKHRAAKDGKLGERRPTPERLGEAFCEYVSRFPKTRLPKAGGITATVVVLLDYDTLLGGLKAARLDTGETISPGLARQLAARSGIIPAVLGHGLDGESVVLDLGRTKRFHTDYQRIAMAITQTTCAVEGCDWPPGLSHAHHDIAWADGGPTDIAHGVLICPRHHTMVHNGTVTYHRRT